LTRTWTTTDTSGNTGSESQVITVQDTTAPLLSGVPADVTVECDAVPDPAEPTATDNCDPSPVITLDEVRTDGTCSNNYTLTRTWTATDACGNSSSQSQVLTVTDTTAPAITCPDPITVEDDGAGSAVVVFTVTATDNCDPDPQITCVDGLGLPVSSGDAFPVGVTTVTCTAADICGNEASCSFDVTVVSTTPLTITSLNAAPSVASMGSPVSLVAEFIDNLGDTHTADWYYGDGDADEDVPVDSEPTASTDGSTSTSHTYMTAGVFTVEVVITDSAGNTATESIFVVVYDPDGGFVTGGGWIDSPEGAYAADPSLTGRANFGFVSKYKKGATTPTGQTEFQFKVAELNFHSVSYQWLVVAGARAQYKGSGTINQQGDYGFMLTAIDGAMPGGGGVDKFRIKIWDQSMNDQIVYDNQMDAGDEEDPTTSISGGSIVIHNVK
jgi:hypothetical protein